MPSRRQPHLTHPARPLLPLLLPVWLLPWLLLSFGCDGGAEPAGAGPAAAAQQRVTLRVGCAASIRAAVEELAARYAAENVGIDLRVQGGGSAVLARRALDLAEPVDVLVLADASLFSELLQPVWTRGHIAVASDRLVLARAKRAPGGDRVTAANWSELLLADGVRVGMADPDRAPLGYRTLLSWQLAGAALGDPGLAGALRARVGARHVWPDAAALLSPLQAGEIDYAVLYASSARAAGVASIELPAEINLGDPARAAGYRRARVQVAGSTAAARIERVGEPIVYAAAAWKRSGAGRHAEAFIALLTSAAGQATLRRHGFAAVAGPLQ